MSTNPAPAPKTTAEAPAFFKDPAEFQAFIKRTVTEEVPEAFAKAMAPYTEKTQNAMRDMLEAHDREHQESKMPPGLLFARGIRAYALAFKEAGVRNDPEAAILYAKKHWPISEYDSVVKGLEGAVKLKATAVQASDPSTGTFIIPQWSREFVAMLRGVPVIRSIARVVPNPTGSLTLRRQTSGSTVYWVGEGQPITASKPGVGLMQFLRKKLAGLAILSNDWLRYGGPEADAFILQDLLDGSALGEDLAFIRGDGTQYTPRGIRNLLAAANVFAQTATTLAGIDADHAKALRLVEEANIVLTPDAITWLLVPRTYYALWNAAPATDAGARPYREDLRVRDARAPEGRLLGYPVRKTTQIPKNLGGGSETETYAVHGPSCIIADTLNVQVDVFPGGAYQDGATVVSGISNDETPVRVLRETDFNLRYQEAGACITGVTIA